MQRTVLGPTPELLLEQLRLLFRGTQRFVSAKSYEVGLSPVDYFALTRIESSGGIAPGALARELGLTRSSSTGAADRLEEAGLIRRRADPSDGRVVVLTVTAKGRRVVERSLQPILSDCATAIARLGDSQRTVVSELVTEIGRALEARAGDTPSGGPVAPRMRTPSRRPRGTQAS
jgi:DNA-binding MarR family transcriptional regulator